MDRTQKVTPQLYQDQYPHLIFPPHAALERPSWSPAPQRQSHLHHPKMLNFDLEYLQVPIPNKVEHPYVKMKKHI